MRRSGPSAPGACPTMTPPLRKKPRTDALAALCGADDDTVQKYDELLETFDAEQARFSND